MRGRGSPAAASPGAASSRAWQGAGSRRRAARWNNEAERAGPGLEPCRPEQPAERAPVWESPAPGAAVVVLI